MDSGPIVHFVGGLKSRNYIVFKNEDFSLQKLKHLFFVHLLWLETKLFFADGPMTHMHFIDWVTAN